MIFALTLNKYETYDHVTAGTIISGTSVIIISIIYEGNEGGRLSLGFPFFILRDGYNLII